MKNKNAISAHDDDKLCSVVFDPFPDAQRQCLRIASESLVEARSIVCYGRMTQTQEEESPTKKYKLDLPSWSSIPDDMPRWDYETVPEGTDMIITNPPFDIKTELLHFLLPLGVPVCLLLPLDCLTVQAFQEVAKHYRWHVIIPRKRFYFLPGPQDENTKHDKCPPTATRCSFATAWFCYNNPYLADNEITFAFTPALRHLYKPSEGI